MTLLADATPDPEHPGFATTHWSRVMSARGDSTEARDALRDLCAAYYEPVVGFLRREGRSEDHARELAHEFFAQILAKTSLSNADPNRGRFRSYLLGALKHFVANRDRAARRPKRGAGAKHEPLLPESDTSPGLDVPDATVVSPEMAFDREWAVTLLERVFAVLASEAEASGRTAEYRTLKPWLTTEGPDRSQADAANRLGMTETAVRVAIHRLRRRFGRLVTAEIERTVAGPSDVSDELRHLIATLS